LDPRYAFEAWKRLVGPVTYAFQCGDATFILLNNVEFFGRDAAGVAGRCYRGRIGEPQLRFVENVLRNVPEDHLIVVSMHIPLVSFDNPDSPSDTTSDRDALLKILSGRRHTVSFSGHSHTTEHHYLGVEYGFALDEPHHHHVLTASCGSWWSGPADQRGIPVADSRDGSPKGFHVLSVDRNRYTTRFVPFGLEKSRSFRTLVVDRSADQRSASQLDRKQSAEILVDVFDGGPRTRVRCEIAGNEGFELQRRPIKDPFIVDSFARHKAMLKPWVEPAYSSHVWIGTLPDALTAGKFEIAIHVTGEYGQEHKSTVTISVPS
jgi:hypothetical protein